MLESTNRLNEYMSRPKTEGSDYYAEENKDDVLMYLMEKGVSFPSEMSRVTQIHIESVNKVLNYFIKLGYIKRTVPDRWNPQPVFKARMPELWGLGMDSYQRLILCSWWMITPGGIEYIKTKYPNQDKQIKGALLITYGMEHPEFKYRGKKEEKEI